MAGLEVSRALLDAKAAEALLELRNAYDKATVVRGWLELHPIDTDGTDPLTVEPFSYTATEASNIRTVFDQLGKLQIDTLADLARPLTGLS